MSVVRDVLPERGSLAGLYTALSVTQSAILVTAWDMPFVPSALLAAIRAVGEQRECAVVPEFGGRWQPFCAYYPRAAIDVAKRQLDAGDQRMRSFLNALPCVDRFADARLLRFGAPDVMFFNVNSPDDLEQARVVANAARHA